MINFYRKLFDIREGEGLKVSLMFFYGFSIIASLSILKPVRNSLFLVKLGVEKLPVVYILVALCSAVVASIYSRYARKVKLIRLIMVTLFISILSLLLFWYLLESNLQGDWLKYALYIWVAIFGVITGTQFWLLANDIFNAREAKRLFGLIGAGAISGGVFGGILTYQLAPLISTENLIFLCVGFLIVCQFLVWIIWKKSIHVTYRDRSARRRQVTKTRSSDNPLKLIFSSRHLSYLTGIIFLGVIVAHLVDFQFSALAKEAYPDADRLTAFFGLISSTLNIISIAIQIFLTNRIIKNLGVAASLFFLPLALFVGAIAILISPALWSAILVKIGDGGFKHSINKASTELLILPIPAEIKAKAKAFIDVFIKNFAKGFGGIILIALTAGLGFSVQHISLLSIVLIIAWAFLILRIKGEYINSFRVAIEKRSINLSEQSLNLEDAAVFQSFMKILEGKNERQILYVLNLLEDVKNKGLIPHLETLIKHSSLEVKAVVLRMALAYEELNFSEEAKALVENEDMTVQTSAMHYLCKTAEKSAEKLQGFINSGDYKTQIAAVVCAANEWIDNKEIRKEINLKILLDGMINKFQEEIEDEEKINILKISTAEIIGQAKDPDLFPYLHLFAEDASPVVKRAAIISMGQTPNNEFIPVLLKNLNTRHIRKYARESLAEYGEDIIVILTKLLEGSDEDEGRRLAIPKVLALIGSQKSVNLLSKNLSIEDLPLRFQIIKALNKLRVNYPELKFDQSLLNKRILEEIDLYNRILSSWLQQNQNLLTKNATQRVKDERDHNQKVRLFLVLALEERLDDSLERIFRLLSLKYSPKDMFNAFLGLVSDKTILKANAIEFLDNVLETNLKKLIIPLVETSRPEVLAKQSYLLSRFKIPTEEDAILSILAGNDNWLKTCTLYLIATIRQEKYAEAIKKLTEASDPLVRETAKFSLRRITSR
ncbi:Npt1/Npt2 family nucleotide transporter [Acidobacteriota bacterium]